MTTPAPSKLRVVTVVGTRPEIIRLSRVIALLDRHVHHVLVHTGQNYDYELNGIFFRELKIRKPDYVLDVNTTSLGALLGEILIKTERVLMEVAPDAVLILGDTNSSIAAIIAKRLRVPIYHMEAGNRCFDLNVPEEINRRIIDHVADFNLVYTEHARRHLLAEGLSHRRIYLTGSPMREVLEWYQGDIERSTILQRLGIERSAYFVVSVHREENVDHPDTLWSVVSCLNKIAATFGKPIILSTHPRTRQRLRAQRTLRCHPLLRAMKPFGFFDYVHLEQHALCTISDSGTISEEAAILAFPAVTIRTATERPEALDAGTMTLTGLDPDTVIDAIRLARVEAAAGVRKIRPAEYEVRDTSWRVLRLILGTAKLSNSWSGIARSLQNTAQRERRRRARNTAR